MCLRQEAERLRGHKDYLVEGGKDTENSYEKFIEGYFQRHKKSGRKIQFPITFFYDDVEGVGRG